jgi:hypothetical protein
VKHPPMRLDRDLAALMKAANEAFDRLSPEEKKAHRRAQAISFVYGNLAIENDSITREMVEKAYDERH